MLKLKQKTCKCGKLAMRNRRICYHCDCEKRKAKRIAEAQKWAEKRAKKKARFEQGETYRKRLFKKAWKVWSEWVRRGGEEQRTFNYCFTCGIKKHYKNLQAGHFHHGKLDFSPINVRPQCPKCNKFLSGNLSIYAERLVAEGIDLKQLRRDAEAKGNGYTISELREIILKYESKSAL